MAVVRSLGGGYDTGSDKRRRGSWRREVQSAGRDHIRRVGRLGGDIERLARGNDGGWLTSTREDEDEALADGAGVGQ